METGTTVTEILIFLSLKSLRLFCLSSEDLVSFSLEVFVPRESHSVFFPIDFRAEGQKKDSYLYRTFNFNKYVFYMWKTSYVFVPYSLKWKRECYCKCSKVKSSCMANFVFRIFFWFMRISLIQILFALVFNPILLTLFSCKKPCSIVTGGVCTDTYSSQKM